MMERRILIVLFAHIMCDTFQDWKATYSTHLSEQCRVKALNKWPPYFFALYSSFYSTSLYKTFALFVALYNTKLRRLLV